MTLKELAHAARQHLQTRAGCAVKQSHVHELLAAAFGYQSWAAFPSESLLADTGVGGAPEDASPRVIGRALQLGYGQSASVETAGALLGFVAERKLSAVRWSEITALLESPPRSTKEGDGDDDEEEDWDGDDEVTGIETQDATRDRLLQSPSLQDGLERSAEGRGAEHHHVLAALCRCARPNLKAAALGGIRAAAVECAAVVESREFFELSELLSGDVDAERMAQIAATPEAQAKWLQAATRRRRTKGPNLRCSTWLARGIARPRSDWQSGVTSMRCGPWPRRRCSEGRPCVPGRGSTWRCSTSWRLIRAAHQTDSVRFFAKARHGIVSRQTLLGRPAHR
jgi:hypothetical protein